MPMLIPVIAAVAGAGVKYYGQKKAAESGQTAAAAGAAQLAADRRKAMAEISGATTAEANLSPAQRTAQAHQDYMDALRSGAPQMASSYASVPGANPRYAEAVKTASDSATSLAQARANLIAGIRGATRSREDVHQKLLDTNTNIQGIGQDANLDAANANMAVQQASQVNPAYGIAGGILENIGKAYGGGGGAGAAMKAPGLMDTSGISYFKPADFTDSMNLGDSMSQAKAYG
jgi:hypothetical protein